MLRKPALGQGLQTRGFELDQYQSQLLTVASAFDAPMSVGYLRQGRLHAPKFLAGQGIKTSQLELYCRESDLCRESPRQYL